MKYWGRFLGNAFATADFSRLSNFMCEKRTLKRTLMFLLICPINFYMFTKRTKLAVANWKTTHFKLLCLNSFGQKRATEYSGNCSCNNFQVKIPYAMFVIKVTTVLVSRGTPLMRRKGMFEQASDEGRRAPPVLRMRK